MGSHLGVLNQVFVDNRVWGLGLCQLKRTSVTLCSTTHVSVLRVSKQFIERKHSKINLPVIMLGFGGMLNSYNVGSE